MRFWQSQARAQGSGLGLYLVRGLARAHGGDAVVVEAPDGRAHIHVRLPAAAPGG
jgi:signal transduction histidine kinase